MTCMVGEAEGVGITVGENIGCVVRYTGDLSGTGSLSPGTGSLSQRVAGKLAHPVPRMRLA